MVFTKSFAKVPNECFQVNNVNNESKNKRAFVKWKVDLMGRYLVNLWMLLVKAHTPHVASLALFMI
jgi:hypothetical protein